jgi:hypothetical protein
MKKLILLSFVACAFLLKSQAFASSDIEILSIKAHMKALKSEMSNVIKHSNKAMKALALEHIENFEEELVDKMTHFENKLSKYKDQLEKTAESEKKGILKKIKEVEKEMELYHEWIDTLDEWKTQIESTK